MNSKKYFLILQTANFLGDLILLIPSLRKLRSLEPDAQLIMVCRKGLGSFFLKMKLVDQVYEIIKKDNASYRKAFEKVKDIFFECVFCHHEFLRCAIFAKKVKAKQKIGFKKWWNFFLFDKRIPIRRELPEPLKQMSLLASLDADLKKSIHTFYHKEYLPFLKAYKNEKSFFSLYNLRKKRKMDLKGSIKRNHEIKNDLMENKKGIANFPLKEDIFSWPKDFFVPSWASLSLKSDFIKKDLDLEQKIQNYKGKKTQSYEEKKAKRIFLAPRGGLSTKVWHRSGFLNLGKRLAFEGWEVLFIGLAEERKSIDEISRLIPNSKNLAGKTNLYELACLFLTGRALIANDSGALHMAAALELPTVLVLGPSDLNFRFLPWQNHWRVVKRNFKCSPCYSQKYWTPPAICPLATHHCMSEIDPNSVYLALKNLLGNRGSRASFI